MEPPKPSCVPDWSQWDASLMEWKKDRAPSFHESEFPTPLYIFGYGSLIWRPALLEQYPYYHATAVGYRRLFAQKSCDHRGTCKFPGLVLNLVTDDYLASRGYCEGSNELKSYDCHGLIWLIPQDRVRETLEYLDHRERGGYDRHFVPVVVKESTPYHEPNSIIQALAYVGHETNPNFYLPPLYSTPHDFNKNAQNIFNLQGRSVVTDIIAAAKGCSGTNVEYLLRLQHYLHERHMADDYINNLARAVRHRIGVWRKKALHINLADRSSLPKFNKIIHDYALKVHLSGWGSNDEGQLRCSPATSIETRVIDISNEIPPIFRTEKVGIKQRIAHRPHWEDVEDYQVVAGGSSSAFLHDNVIVVWGKLASDILKMHTNTFIENDNSNFTIIIEHVMGAAIGHSHILLLLQDGIVVGLGENSNNQCGCPLTIGLAPSEFCLELVETPDDLNLYRIKYLKDVTKSALKYKVAKLSAGIHHSAALTICGGLITWGEDKFGQSFANVSADFVWYPENSHLIDVGCGAKQTIVVDDAGRIFSMGCNRYGSLGRRIVSDDRKSIDRSMGELLFPSDVRFQRVSCGWSHSVARGIFPNGDLAFFAWGRRDLNQYVAVDTIEENEWQPQQLSQLPSRAQILEVWCGSEYTIVVDDQDGQLWGVGWNEHGNIGNGTTNSPIATWEKVQRAEGPLRVHVWEGSIACGGGHVLCVSK